MRDLVDFIIDLDFGFSRGGVLTPGTAFGQTTMMDYLRKEGFSFGQL